MNSKLILLDSGHAKLFAEVAMPLKICRVYFGAKKKQREVSGGGERNRLENYQFGRP